MSPDPVLKWTPRDQKPNCGRREGCESAPGCPAPSKRAEGHLLVHLSLHPLLHVHLPPHPRGACTLRYPLCAGTPRTTMSMHPLPARPPPCAPRGGPSAKPGRCMCGRGLPRAFTGRSHDPPPPAHRGGKPSLFRDSLWWVKIKRPGDPRPNQPWAGMAFSQTVRLLGFEQTSCSAHSCGRGGSQSRSHYNGCSWFAVSVHGQINREPFRLN